MLRCVNCHLCVDRMLRHVVLSLESTMQTLLATWKSLQQLPPDAVICQACFVQVDQYCRNGNMNAERELGHTHVCLGCGRSVLERSRSIRYHTLEASDPLIATILSWDVNNEVLARNTFVCHLCWMRASRQLPQDNIRGLPGTDEQAQIKHEPVEPEQLLTPQQAIPVPPPLPQCQLPQDNIRGLPGTDEQAEIKHEPEQLLTSQQAIPVPPPLTQRQLPQDNIRGLPGTDEQAEIKHEPVEPEQLLTSQQAIPVPPPLTQRQLPQDNIRGLPGTDEQAEIKHQPVEPEQLLTPQQEIPVPPPLPQPQEQRRPTASAEGVIILPHYKRVPNTSRHCIFEGCAFQSGHLVPMPIKVMLLKQCHIYVPFHARICNTHLYTNEWSLLNNNNNLTDSFTSAQIEDIIRIMEKNADFMDFENVHDMPNHICHYWTGLNVLEFLNLFNEIPVLANVSKGKTRLAIYLTKLTTGDSDNRLSALYKMPRSTLESYLKTVRSYFIDHNVPNHIGLQHNRVEVAQRNLAIPNNLSRGRHRSLGSRQK